MTDEEKKVRIKELLYEKVTLLDKYGLFGGGSTVAAMFRNINEELESLGVDPNY